MHFLRFIFAGILTICVVEMTSQIDSFSSSYKADLSTLHNYIDSIAQSEMEKANIPGAVIAVIQNWKQSYIQGYGLSDVENDVPVNPDSTGFRIASITKTVTATAIMQLVEEGILDLHQPISDYLPGQNFTFLHDEPMTIHQLLTHTAGIDLTDIGDAAKTPDQVVPLEQFVRYHIPDQINSPGEVHSYSNFGYALLDI